MINQQLVLFDGYCELCSSSVRFIRKHGRRGMFRFLPLQGEEAEVILSGSSQKTEFPDTIILVDKGRFFVKSSAVLRIASKLKFPFNMAALFLAIPRFLRDPLYDLIARNRKRWFGTRETCYLPE